MKNRFPEEIEKYRIIDGPLKSIRGFGFNGAFRIPYKTKSNQTDLFVVVSDLCGWDHVSISTRQRCPNHNEMSFIKNLFWDETETVVHFFPKKSEYVNKHPFCLHLWKRHDIEFKLPPNFMVG